MAPKVCCRLLEVAGAELGDADPHRIGKGLGRLGIALLRHQVSAALVRRSTRAVPAHRPGRPSQRHDAERTREASQRGACFMSPPPSRGGTTRGRSARSTARASSPLPASVGASPGGRRRVRRIGESPGDRGHVGIVDRRPTIPAPRAGSRRRAMRRRRTLPAAPSRQNTTGGRLVIWRKASVWPGATVSAMTTIEPPCPPSRKRMAALWRRHRRAGRPRAA